MIFKLITLIVLTICAAEERMLWPNHPAAFTIPDQKNYKQNSAMTHSFNVNPYSSPGPQLRAGPVIPSLYQRIQYAPLVERISQRNKNTAVEFTKYPPTTAGVSALSAVSAEPFIPQQRERNVYKKDHLEPRLVPTEKKPDPKCFHPENSSGQSVIRSPGHNAVYRDFPDPRSQTDKAFKMNPAKNAFEVHRKLDQANTTMMPSRHQDLKGHYNPANKHHALNPNAIEPEGPVMEKVKRQWSPYAKFHRLHLNIARVYSPVQVPQKVSVLPDTYSVNFRSLPVRSQTYLSPVFKPLPEQKTVLHPVRNQKDGPKKTRF